MSEHPELELSHFLVLQQPQTSHQEDTHGMQWTRHDTLCLLHLYKEYRKQVGSLRIKSLRRMYEEISKEMRRQTNKNISPSNCENRWKHLERSYKKVKDNNLRTGRGRKAFEYEKELDEILGHQKNINPILVLSTHTKDVDFPVEDGGDKEDNTLESFNISNVDGVDVEADTLINISTHTSTPNKKRNFVKKNKQEYLRQIRNDRRQFYKDILEEKRKKNDILSRQCDILSSAVSILNEIKDKL